MDINSLKMCKFAIRKQAKTYNAYDNTCCQSYLRFGVQIHKKIIMIISDLNNSKRIELLHPLFKTAFDYIKSHDLLNMPLGRIEIDSDCLFINNAESELVDKECQKIEVHQQYIDIHVPLNGEEIIGWKALADLSVVDKTYNKEADFGTFAEPASTYVTLKPGQFLVAWPEDGHAPIIGHGILRKAIVKIKL